jgi:translation initiation factor IF-3
VPDLHLVNQLTSSRIVIDWRGRLGVPGATDKQRRRNVISKNLRCNDQIRTSPIRLIDENDGQIGIIETKVAIQRAQVAGLDLVEVAPTSKPPVCRIMDYGKWKYAQRKKEAKSKSHQSELKEIRIKTPKIDSHDLEIKIEHAKGFLSRGDRVQFSLRFRGRELAHIDEGKKIFEDIKIGLSEIAKVEQDHRYEGKRITMLLSPAPKKKEVPPGAKTPATAGQPAAPGQPVAQPTGQPVAKPAAAPAAPAAPAPAGANQPGKG